MGGYWKPSMAPQFFHCVKRITSVLGKINLVQKIFGLPWAWMEALQM